MLALETLRQWLADEAEALRTKGFDTKVKHDERAPKPSAALEAASNKFVGLMCIWVTGELDIDIMDLETGKVVVTRYGLRVNDENHLIVLRQFADNLLKLGALD